MKNSIIMKRDLAYVSSSAFIPWEKLREKTIFVTGGTGLIGLNLIKSVLYANQEKHLNVRIIALVRSLEKAAEVFQDETEDTALTFVKGDVTALPEIRGEIDYIIHAASATASRFFIEHPVETIGIGVDGTRNMLELARSKRVSGFVYLSSMEVYGHPEKGHSVQEHETAGFDTANVRNSYPLSKQICESLCASYADEYDVPTMCIRLTQTFGPGVSFDDGRVFAEFMRAVVKENDIVLKTRGETERCYLYTADSVTAILTVLLKGRKKTYYNAANPATYCSIMEMAKLVADEVSGGKIKVSVELADVEKMGYASVLYMMLDVSKLRALGWNTEISLAEMFRRMIADVVKEQ